MDNKAFYSAFNNYAGLLQQSARNFAGNMEDARVLYQETAFQVSRQKEGIEESGSFKDRAIHTMRTIFLNGLRKKKYRLARQPLNPEPVQPMSTALENILDRLEELDEMYRVPFWNHYMGLSEQEIAEHTGLPVETVKERIAIARRQLSSLFREAQEA
ncbi:MAG: sigma-70 family RNA polymerase sigma factor [Phaeodactylibacter sp.]|nr:sigma-70 family RNA polymerase sigma factor [Phaeodactylibacter sp.]